MLFDDEVVTTVIVIIISNKLMGMADFFTKAAVLNLEQL